MAKERVIFVLPIPLKQAKKIGKLLRASGEFLSKRNKHLKTDLIHTEIGMSPSEFMGFALFTGMFYFIITFVLVSTVSYLNTGAMGVIGLLAAIFLGLASMFFVSIYPKTLLTIISKETNRDMLGAMRHLNIQIKSGVPLFNAMASITKGYGKVSQEFDKIIRDINAGVKEVDALNAAAERNESIFFRRAIWQIVNVLQSGSDLAGTVNDITKAFAKAQEVEIRKYGQELNPMTMIYMILSVIFPSLGITFLIILSTFAGLPIPPGILVVIIIFVVVFQFFFIGFVKSKRPNIDV